MKRSGDELMSFASSPMPKAASGLFAPWPSKLMKTGWRPIVTSIWKISESTKNSHYAKSPNQMALTAPLFAELDAHDLSNLDIVPSKRLRLHGSSGSRLRLAEG